MPSIYVEMSAAAHDWCIRLSPVMLAYTYEQVLQCTFGTHRLLKIQV